LSVAAIVASSVLIFRVLPRSSHVTEHAVVQFDQTAAAEALIAELDHREARYVLTRDARHLQEYDVKDREMRTLLSDLERSAHGIERSLVAAAAQAYERSAATHAQLVNQVEAPDGLRTGLADERLATQRALAALHRVVIDELQSSLGRNRTQAVGLTVALLALGFVPAAAAFLLGRALRKLGLEHAATIDRRRLAEAQRVAQLGSWENDVRTDATTWSDEMYRIFGYAQGEVTPSLAGFTMLVHPEDQAAVFEAIAAAGPDNPTFTFVNRIIRPDGELRWLQTQGEMTYASDGTPLKVVGTAFDITERQLAADDVRQAQDQLVRQEADMRHRAYHDVLTGLPNRALLMERLERTLRNKRKAAVLLLDLDGFKRINDSLGHGVGDRLLVRISERLAASVRGVVPNKGVANDRPRDTVARLGGDEFAILLIDANENCARVVAERVLAECRAPFSVDGRELVVSGSIGVAMASPTSTAADLLRNADVAMYAAKDGGGHRQALFDPAMHAAVVERLALENELRHAIETDGLAVHYQPIVDPLTGDVVTVEALVRWPHPTRGMLPPDRFIPLAEETGLIVPLGAWVLHQACQEVATHSKNHPDLKVSVNLSAIQLDEPSLVTTVAQALAASGIEAKRLVLEVTESVVMEHDPSSFAVLDELRELGVALAIDDFGTGYSSLSRLRVLPVTELKIDKSFIDEVDQDGERAPVVAAVIALAHSLGHSVVAEGVETRRQLLSLERLGCDHVQGYLFSKPLPPSELAEVLALASPYHDLVQPDAAPAPSEVQRALMETVAHAVEDSADLDGLVRPILAELAELTGLESTYLTRIDLDRGEQEILVSHNAGELEIGEGQVVPWRDTLCRQALAGGPRATGNVPRDYPGSPAAAGLGIKSYAMAPVTTAEGALLGTLCAASTSTVTVDRGTPALMDLFAQLIADALHERVQAAQRKLRVMVVDDSSAIRELLVRVIAVDGSMEVIAEAADGEEAIIICAETQPDLVLLDLDMPKLDGIAALPLLLQAAPNTRVVVLSGLGDVRREEAMAAGAVAVIDKHLDATRLRAVLAAVA
jgi:diguanylate cyclase (GGDEF)-like protein/PAS domain S-box-containing protein